MQVGLVAGANGKFVQFAYKKKGVLQQLLPPAVETTLRGRGGSDATLAMGDVICEVALTCRPPDAAEADADAPAEAGDNEVEADSDPPSEAGSDEEDDE